MQTDHPLFFNQTKANDYIATLSDPTVRLLLQAVQGVVGANLIKQYQEKTGDLSSAQPVDMLLLVQLMHEFFRRKEYITAIMSGKYDSLQEVWDSQDSWFSG